MVLTLQGNRIHGMARSDLVPDSDMVGARGATIAVFEGVIKP
jgi:hypothetical protein